MSNSDLTSSKPLSGRIQSLDGLRALSILLVLASHGARVPGTPLSKFWFKGIFDLGNLGVRVFFVISGFLITTLLMKETAKTGGVDLKDFFLRRLFRIFPAFYFFLAMTALAGWAGWIPISKTDLLHAVTYTANYQPRAAWGPGQWYVGHSWSLAVEEQFYLLWPTAIYFLGLRRSAYVAGAALFLSPLFRALYGGGFHFVSGLADSHLFLWLQGSNMRSFETVADAIALGCLFALFRDRLWGWRWYRGLITTRAFFLVPVGIAALAALDGNFAAATLGHRFLLRFAYFGLGISLINIGVLLILDRYTRFPNGRVGTFLNLPPIAFFGTLSYSIYLWQQPFLSPSGPAPYCRFPLNVALITGCALLSYYCVEHPILRRRAQFIEWLSPSGPAPEEAE